MSELTEPTVRNISNSEVTAFLSCKRQYDFAFIDNLEPKITSDPLARGGLGHDAFQAYVEARLNGSNHSQAMKAVAEIFAYALRNETHTVDIVMNTKFLVERYLNYMDGFPKWKFLGTEERLDLPLTDNLNMTIRYDLYLEELTTSKRRILDWKFAYNFWQPWEHELNSQMPKYVAVMQANNFQVDGGLLQEIRSRTLGPEKSADAKNLWKTTPYNPSIAIKQNMLHQHVAASLAIERHRKLTPDERRNESIPVLNKHGACKYCNFKDLCKSMLEGKKDLSVDIRHAYKQNTYGYNHNKVEDI